MKISLNWLKNYIDLDDKTPDEIENRITLLGLEVDEMESIGSDLEGVVVGKVLTCVQHPNADRLKVTTVDIGSGEPVQIVCGAPNVAVGQTVPVATVGCTLPVEVKPGELLTIKKNKIRGEVSEGMICAVDEMGLGEDHSGILVLDTNKPLGTPINQVLKTNKDVVFEISITPNRPDATCHLGVARDLAAAFNRPLKTPEVSISNDAGKVRDYVDIEILNPEKCHRYTAKVIKNVTIKESPEWLQQALLAIGLRPINNVVDATNYVMYELGQPLHAFDLKQISSKKIVVRAYENETEFITLDSQKRKIPADTLYICDGENPVALAGIMGGENSEISDSTTDVLLETAYFEPTGIRKSAKRIGLQTDASYRFERGIDPNVTLLAAERCAQLIADLAGGELVDGTLDVHPIKTEPKTVSLTTSYTNRILGTQLDQPTIQDLLKRLQFSVSVVDTDTVSVVVPTFRPDIERSIDLVEEVARVMDYNTIESPKNTTFHTPSPYPFHETFTERNKAKLAGLGFTELYQNSLLPESYALEIEAPERLIRTLNPISKDLTFLRDSLRYGFLKTIAFNLNRGNHSLSLFEIGHVFEASSENHTEINGVKEHVHAGFALCGYRSKEEWTGKAVHYSFADLKSKIYAWFKALRLENSLKEVSVSATKLEFILNETSVGYLEVIDPKKAKAFDLAFPVYFAEFDFTLLEKIAEKLDEFKAVSVPKFPSFEFDLALVVDKGIQAGEMSAVLQKSAGRLLTNYHVFDVFEGGSLADGKKSVGYRMTFKDDSRTLTMQDIEPIIKKILKNLNQQFAAELRQ
ncbi:phenylalanine--tRNA ligase subunit beta [bacterium]|nr:MAG: phenylalanine--tRNA ligase subunit beta [bacterium]